MHLISRAGWLAALAACALSPSIALSQDVKAGDLVIEHPWSRATPGGAEVAGGYVTIVNNGKAPDRLVGGSFPAAAGFELHDMSMTGGIMTMRPTGPLEIPAGGTLALTPSGKHAMLTGLRQDLKKGQDVEGTLVFERAGTVPVHFTVEDIGAKAPAGAEQGASGSGMDMK